jgi:molybdenum cofactor cytidylyltransferase
MSRAPSLCAVILAAGDSARMGRDKALLSWPPATSGEVSRQTFLSAAIAALSPFNDMVLVVAGKNADNIAPIIYANAGFLIRNPAPERGQFSSLQTGLQEVLNRGRDAAMITLVDRPPVTAATLRSLRDAFILAVAGGKWAVVPEFRGQHGHPIIIAREMIEVFLKAAATATARDLEHQHQARIEYVPVGDPFVATNVDTPDDYAALSALQLK